MRFGDFLVLRGEVLFSGDMLMLLGGELQLEIEKKWDVADGSRGYIEMGLLFTWR